MMISSLVADTCFPYGVPVLPFFYYNVLSTKHPIMMGQVFFLIVVDYLETQFQIYRGVLLQGVTKLIPTFQLLDLKRKVCHY